MANFKKLKDGEGNVYLVKDEQARSDLSSHTGNTSNPHSVTKAQVGLGNVDNTSDLNKPVSTAQQTALDLKINKSSIKTSTPENPSNDDVPGMKYLEDTFAKISVFYETLGCGYALLADNLDTKLTINDQLAYIERTTAGGEEVANTCKVHSIIGGSLGWNQLANKDVFVNTDTKSNVTFTRNNDGSYTINGTTDTLTSDFKTIIADGSYVNMIPNHKIMFLGLTTGLRYQCKDDADHTVFVSNDACIVIYPYSKLRMNYYFTAGASFNNFRSWVQIIDLTACFGPTIADYLYNLANNGGVAWFKRYFPKDYYPFKAIGDFTHVKISGKKYTKFNQFDLPTFVSTYGTGGVIANNVLNSKILWENTENYQGRIEIYHKGITKTGSGVIYIIFKYTDGTNSSYVSENIITADGTSLSANGKIVDKVTLLYSADGSHNFTNAKMCISFYWDGSRSGEYEDYNATTYAIDPIDIIGIPKIDANGNLYFEGNRYNSDGSVDEEYDTKIIAINDVGEVSNSYANIKYFYIAKPSTFVGYGNYRSIVGVMICDKFVAIKGDPYDTASMIGTVNGDAQDNRLWFGFTPGTTLAQAQTALNGAVLIYKKNTTTQGTPATPFSELQTCDNWGAEIDLPPEDDTRDVEVPVSSDTDYIANLKDKVESAPGNPANDGVYVMTREDGENSYTLLSNYLSNNGYEKVVDLSSGITDSAGVLYALKKAIKIGNVVTMSVAFTNNTGSAISANTTLFTLSSDLKPTYTVSACVSKSGAVTKIVINSDGEASCIDELANGSVLQIQLTYFIS